MNDVLKNGYYESALCYNNVDWFKNGVKKMAVFFRKTKKDIIMTEQNEEEYRNSNICRVCETNIESDKVTDHCQLTGKYRGQAHSKSTLNVTQEQSNFIPFMFQNFSNYDILLFFKKLVDKRHDKVKSDIIPKTNEDYTSVTKGCSRFIDIYRFLSSSLDSLVKTLADNSHKTLKHCGKENVNNDEILKNVEEIKVLNEEDKYKIDSIKDLKKDYPDESEKLEKASLIYMDENDKKILKREFLDIKWKYLTKRIAYPYEYFNSLDDYRKPVDNLKKTLLPQPRK